MTMEYTPKVARSVLSDVIDAAQEHIYQCQLAGIDSTTGEDLEKALSRVPCLFCGVTGFSHSDDCDRVFYRGRRFFEQDFR